MLMGQVRFSSLEHSMVGGKRKSKIVGNYSIKHTASLSTLLENLQLIFVSEHFDRANSLQAWVKISLDLKVGTL